MEFLINAFFSLLAFFGMEGVAWFTHKYLMHGLLWNLHEDHHKKDQYGFFEKNDYFFLIFATPGIVCLIAGITTPLDFLFWIGLGITVYGFAYFLVHDVFIHQRIRWFRRGDSMYFKAIRKAHKVHHKKMTKEDGECFGMLWVPLKYFRDAKRASKS